MPIRSNNESDEQLIAFALRMWANWIETRDPLMGREELINRIRHGTIRREAVRMNLYPCTDEQKGLISRLRRLATNQET